MVQPPPRAPGTLWEERFKCVPVGGDEKSLLTMAAYIDLNPVRAGMVARPEDYRWCGYAAAAGGSRRARAGLARALRRTPPAGEAEGSEGPGDNLERAGPAYRLWLYGQGEARGTPGGGDGPDRNGFTREEVEAEVARGGKLPLLREAIQCGANGSRGGGDAAGAGPGGQPPRASAFFRARVRAWASHNSRRRSDTPRDRNS